MKWRHEYDELDVVLCGSLMLIGAGVWVDYGPGAALGIVGCFVFGLAVASLFVRK